MQSNSKLVIFLYCESQTFSNLFLCTNPLFIKKSAEELPYQNFFSTSSAFLLKSDIPSNQKIPWSYDIPPANPHRIIRKRGLSILFLIKKIGQTTIQRQVVGELISRHEISQIKMSGTTFIHSVGIMFSFQCEVQFA